MSGADSGWSSSFGDGPSFQVLLQTFRTSDPAGIGLRYDELQQLCAGLSLTESQVAALARAADANANGRISYAEFVPLACQLSTMPSSMSLWP